MKQRCLNPNHNRYPDYGGRGIKICKRWMLFVNFYKDMGPRPHGYTLDRIKVNRGYSKANCKWSTPSEQQLNKRRKKKVDNKVQYSLLF